jgi:hypothetical protein
MVVHSDQISGCKAPGEFPSLMNNVNFMPPSPSIRLPPLPTEKTSISTPLVDMSKIASAQLKDLLIIMN